MRIVSTLDELLALPSDRLVNGYRKRIPVRLEIPVLTKPVLVRAQFALNELQERGGSAGAAAFMFVVLILGVMQVYERHTSVLNLRAGAELAIVLGLSFVAGALGKYVALAITRWRFALRCRAQHRRLSELLHELRVAA